MPANYFVGASSSVSGPKFRRRSIRLQSRRSRKRRLRHLSPREPGVIEIEFATGGRMRITGAVDAPTVTALMKALAKGKRRR